MKRCAVTIARKQGARCLGLQGMDFLLNPTEEHAQLREMVARFAKEKVEPQAREADVNADFNVELFRELGELGVMGITVPSEHGGAGMDATAACIVHHELCKYDAGFTLAYLAHSMYVFFFFVSYLEKS